MDTKPGTLRMRRWSEQNPEKVKAARKKAIPARIRRLKASIEKAAQARQFWTIEEDLAITTSQIGETELAAQMGRSIRAIQRRRRRLRGQG